MNEILIFLGTIRDGAWVYLCVLLAVALGLFLFDRQAKAPAAEAEEMLPERRAA